MPRRLLLRTIPLSVYVLWTLFSLYPDPRMLRHSVEQGLAPDTDPTAVARWAETLPDDPERIERAVLGTHVRYAVPWETHGVPWYFPTTAEVVARGAGDCQARAVVLASILEAKGIPYRLEASFDHIWVQYPNKIPNALENKAIALLVDDGTGRSLRAPRSWDWSATYDIEKAYFWDAMPLGRKLLLFGGLGAFFLRRRVRRRAGALLRVARGRTRTVSALGIGMDAGAR